MRINMNIPDDLLKRIDEKSKALYLTRTAWIINAVNQALRADDIMETMPEIKKQIEEFSKTVESYERLQAKKD